MKQCKMVDHVFMSVNAVKSVLYLKTDCSDLILK